MAEFSLSLPSTEEVTKQVQEEISSTPEESSQIHQTVEKTTTDVMNVDLDSFESRQQMTKAFEDFGQDIAIESQKKNVLLEKRMITMSTQGGQTEIVAKSLEDLTIRMKDLDPSGIDFIKSGPLGKLFNPARRYFERFKSADEEISSIVKTLDKGKKTLQEDNVALSLEQTSMRELTKKLGQTIEMGSSLDNCLSAKIEEAKLTGEDPEKIKFVEEELLYPLRQRIMDYQQLMTVNQQGIISMELVRRNNLELIRSVDRAKLVTVNALRTAVMTAQALYDQKIVLDKVNALNATTNQMIESTARMLKDQGTEIHRQASESAVSVDSLKAAFTDTLQALDEISAYKKEALPRMKETISQFAELAAEGEKRITQMERGSN